jgi:quercetin dioxygenase-like cupin family protein
MRHLHFLPMKLSAQHWFGSMLLLVAAATFSTYPPILPKWGGDTLQTAAYQQAPPFILCGSAVPGEFHDPLLNVNADGSPRPVAKIVSSEPLSHAPGKRITITIVTFAPGAWSPPHVHGGTVNVWVLKGAIRSQLNYGAMEIFQPGGTFFEPIGGVHSHSGNVSMTDEAQVMAIFVHDEGATLTTYLQ